MSTPCCMPRPIGGSYAEFLRTDFPRIPFTADWDLFVEFANIGARLADLHLLKSSELGPPVCRFEREGDSMVATTKSKGLRYDPDEQRMYINRDQYFAPISIAAYEYLIGGYQVCDKWLKDRRDRRLELDDIRTYCRMVTAIGLTLEIQQELDEIYNDAEDNCITFEAQVTGVNGTISNRNTQRSFRCTILLISKVSKKRVLIS